MKTRILAVTVLAALAGPASAATYKIDRSNSKVGFEVTHLMVNRVPGGFKAFQGEFTYDPKDPSKWKATAVIDAVSIDTEKPQRDDHLRSPDFFDTDKCPKITFKSTKITGIEEGETKLHGDLTIRCITKPVVLDLLVGEVSGETARFTAKGSIDRFDFGVAWSKAMETGSLMVDRKVDLVLEIEGRVAKKTGKKAKKK